MIPSVPCSMVVSKCPFFALFDCAFIWGGIHIANNISFLVFYVMQMKWNGTVMTTTQNRDKKNTSSITKSTRMIGYERSRLRTDDEHYYRTRKPFNEALHEVQTSIYSICFSISPFLRFVIFELIYLVVWKKALTIEIIQICSPTMHINYKTTAIAIVNMPTIQNMLFFSSHSAVLQFLNGVMDRSICFILYSSTGFAL